jgi:hypothetical protein
MESLIRASVLQEQTGNALVDALENGQVLHFDSLPFSLSEAERALLDPAITSSSRKNISLHATGARLRGLPENSPHEDLALALIERYALQARQWAQQLFPAYRGRLQPEPTSLRLHQAKNRSASWRRDDSRLHVDAFPSRPNQGKRILRVFMNINPQGEDRVWRVGESFDEVARRFLPRLPRPFPGSAWLMQQLRITKSRRSPYDHIMLGLHDAMKADLDYQRDCRQQSIGFKPGAGWMCFSDQATHAVMSGQFMMEQTFFLPVEHMLDPQRSPLAQLQALTGRPLI